MSLSARVGVGLRPTHYSKILEVWPKEVDHFEVISENYMFSQGRPLETLLKIREHYPIFAHGVSMSVMSAVGPSDDYLKALKSFYNLIKPEITSDHLCWTGHAHDNLHDLLPFPFTNEFLDLAVRNISKVQDVLGRSMAFENLSAYMAFKNSDFTEWEFLKEVCLRSGAKLLFDLNNAWVNAVNFGYDPLLCVNSIPKKIVAQIHLGGPTDTGKFLFDTHSTKIPDEVWGILHQTAARFHDIPIIIEWDSDIPEFDVLLGEVKKARSIIESEFIKAGEANVHF